MPESLLLRRLSFTFMSAVETITNLLLSCEPHISHSPRSPHPSRKRSLPMPPGSPTSVTGHVSSPISLLDVEDDLAPSLFDEKSSSRRKRTSRSQNPSSGALTTFRRRAKTSSSAKTDKLSRHPAHLPRRNTHPKRPDLQIKQRQRQEKRTRAAIRRTQETSQSQNERLAFVQPAANKLPGLTPWRRQRNTVQRVASQKRLRPELPVAPIVLPPTIRQVPRGTLTSFLTSEDTTLPLALSKGHDPVNSDEALLEQDVRPSRRVRFAQNVQLVC